MVLILAILAHSMIALSPRRKACADILPNIAETTAFLQNVDPSFWQQVDSEFVKKQSDTKSSEVTNATSDTVVEHKFTDETNLDVVQDNSIIIEKQPHQENSQHGRRLQATPQSIPAGAVVLSSQIVVFNNSSWRQVIYLYNGLYHFATIYLARFVLLLKAVAFREKGKGRRPIAEIGLPSKENPDINLKQSTVAFFNLRDSFVFPDLETLIRCRPDLKPLVQGIFNTTISASN